MTYVINCYIFLSYIDYIYHVYIHQFCNQQILYLVLWLRLAYNGRELLLNKLQYFENS